jgi:hypothetical protein
MRGEEMLLKQGREAGRNPNRKYYRSARDATGINADDREPILSTMPSLPPQ